MYPNRKHAFNAAIIAVAFLFTAASSHAGAHARRLPMAGAFYTNAQAAFSIGEDGLPAIDVVVAGAGCSSHMVAPVTTYSGDEHLLVTMTETGLTGIGGLNAIMRDRNGDTITMKMEMALESAPPTSGYAFTFDGTYTITGGTGRFAGVTGSGCWSGWARPEDAPAADPSLPAYAQGFFRYNGWMVLPSCKK